MEQDMSCSDSATAQIRETDDIEAGSGSIDTNTDVDDSQRPEPSSLILEAGSDIATAPGKGPGGENSVFLDKEPPYQENEQQLIIESAATLASMYSSTDNKLAARGEKRSLSMHCENIDDRGVSEKSLPISRNDFSGSLMFPDKSATETDYSNKKSEEMESANCQDATNQEGDAELSNIPMRVSSADRTLSQSSGLSSDPLANSLLESPRTSGTAREIEEDEWDDGDFVFVTQTSRALNIIEGAFPPHAESVAAPSAPPLFLVEEFAKDFQEPYVNKYASVLALGDSDYALSPTNDELFRILAEYDGSQTMLENCLSKVRSSREKIYELNQIAWVLESRMLVAEENGDVKAIPFQEDISWTRKLLEGLKTKLFAADSEPQRKEGEILVASLQQSVMKEKEARKTELRRLADDLVDRALIASLKRHQAIEQVRTSLREPESIRTTCDALMHYETRDRDVSFVTKSIRQLLGWVMSALLEGDQDDLERMQNQIWLIRRAKRYALKNPPRSLCRVMDSSQSRGTTAQWALNDWIDRWMTMLQVIVEHPHETIPSFSVLAVRTSSKETELFSAGAANFEQDEEVLLALFLHFPFDAGVARITDIDDVDLDRMMARIWCVAEVLGEACSRFKSTCPRFSAEVSAKLCHLLNQAVTVFRKAGTAQSFLDKLVRKASIHLMDRACVVDLSPTLQCISERASWSIFCATMCFARGEDESRFDFSESEDELDRTDNDKMYRDLVGYQVDPAVRQFVRARNLREWLLLAPSVRGNFNKRDESHLARCDFLASLAACRGGALANAIVRELLGLSYFTEIVSCELVNPLVCRIGEKQPNTISLVLHIVALNDTVFFVRNSPAVESLFAHPCKCWEPNGERDLRFFRDWLARDPADIRNILAMELLEKLDGSFLSLESSRNIARMLALCSVAEGQGENENVSLVYTKTVGAYRRSRLIDKFWGLVQRLRLDNLDYPNHSLATEEVTDDEDDAGESEIELLQLTRRQNPTQPLLAFVVGCYTLEADCLRAVERGGRPTAARLLAKMMSRRLRQPKPLVEDEMDAACLEEETKQAAGILSVMRLEPSAFLKEVVLDDVNPAFEFWIRLAGEKDVQFIDMVLREMGRFDIPGDWLRSQFPRRVPVTEVTLLPTRLAIQILIRETAEELPLWFGIGKVLLEQAESISVKELLQTSDQVIPDLLKLSRIRAIYINPCSLSFFGWLELLLQLDDKERHSLFPVIMQFFLSLLFSKCGEANFGHVFFLLAPSKRLLLKAKLRHLAKLFHHDASSAENISVEVKTKLMQLGEIAHYGSQEWLGGNGVDECAPTMDPQNLIPNLLLFNEKCHSIGFSHIIPVILASELKPIALEMSEFSPSLVSDRSETDHLESLTRQSSSKSQLSSMQASVMTQSMMIAPLPVAPLNKVELGKRRSLIALLRRSAAAVVDARHRLLQLDELESQQFAGLYVAKQVECPVLIDKMYTASSSSQPPKAQSGKVVKKKRTEITHARWTVFSLDQSQKAALQQTEARSRGEFDFIQARFAPGLASEELCDVVGFAREQFEKDQFTDPLSEVRVLLEFDCTQLCTCKALRDIWISVVNAAVGSCERIGDKNQTGLFLFESVLKSPWRIKWFHQMLNLDSESVIKAYEMFFSRSTALETNDAVLLLKRLDLAKVTASSDIARLLGLILAAFGRRSSDPKVLDHIRRNVLKLVLSQHLRNDDDGICMVARALVRGSEDGGPLPPTVWTELSAVSDGVWDCVKQEKAREALVELSTAFNRLNDRAALVPCWISLAPSICRRANSLDSILEGWSPWVLFLRRKPSAEEEPLVNGFIACLQRLLMDCHEEGQLVDLLLRTWLWFAQAACSGRAPPSLSRALLRLNWASMQLPLHRAEEVVESMERIVRHCSTAGEALSDEESGSVMALLLRLLEKSSFQRIDEAQSSLMVSGQLLERSFVLALQCADDGRSLAMILSLPIHLLQSDGYSRAIFEVSSAARFQKDSAIRTPLGPPMDSKIAAEINLAIAISECQQRQHSSAYALILTRYVLQELIPCAQGEQGHKAIHSSMNALNLIYLCLRYIRMVCLKNVNGDAESCIVRELLAFVKDESDQVLGFCFEKIVMTNTGNTVTTPLTQTVDYLSVLARSFLPQFLKTSVPRDGCTDGADEEYWSNSWERVCTRALELVVSWCEGSKRSPILVGSGCLLRMFASGKELAGLFSREACAMPVIKEKPLARILNELALDCDLRDFAEKCEQLLESAIATGSALVICAGLCRKLPGLERVAPACNYLILLDFRLAGRDAFFLVADIARNLALSESPSLSRPYKIDRALFVSARLEQVAHSLVHPKDRLAAAALADAFRFCCTKTDITFSALDSSGLKGAEVDWVKANARVVEFATLPTFVDSLRGALWPSSISIATKLTTVVADISADTGAFISL